MVLATGFRVEDYVRRHPVYGRIHSIHGRAYTDQHIFDLEMERIFGRSWVYVAHASEVASPGDYKATTIGLQPVIVTRDADDGEIHVLQNRCRHRAATVCQAEKGNASYFRCAYHGWTYNNRGDLIGVPYRHGYGERFAYRDYGLIKVPRVGNYRGFIFASLAQDGPSLEEYIGHAHTYLDRFVDQSPLGEIEAKCGVHKYGYDGNWKYQAENTADNYHVDFTHQVAGDIRVRRARAVGLKSTGLKQPAGARVRDLGGGHSVNDRASMGRFLDYARSTMDGRRYLQALESKYGLEQAEYLVRHADGVPFTFRMFPNLVLIQFQIRVIIPIAPDRTEVWLYPVRIKGAPDEINALRLRYHEEFYGPAGFGAPDDVEMFGRAQRGLRAKGNEWTLLERGLGHEQPDSEGLLYSEIKDETGQRAIWEQWAKLMAVA
jgi:phenylpropionate dioxygenase-like ring-hydroxylating dioxygenase large terminal subunit